MIPAKRLVAAGLMTAAVDFLWACVLTRIYGSTFTRLWQGVASVLLGASAFEGGTRTVVIGLAMHLFVAFAWSAVFLLLVNAWPWLRRVLDSRGGIVKIAVVYGPFVWAVMSLIVIPLLTKRAPTVTVRWWIQLAGHALFVGLPIVAMIGRRRV
ncbi:MAG TPA: hypothetical protein VGD79_03585 [Thermoanaerobaculia bacterium]|jgi:hypothetical protein